MVIAMIRNTENINVGDTVYADFTAYSRTDVRTGKVVAKSATGVIKVDFGKKAFDTGEAMFTSFKPNAEERNPSSKWNAARLLDAAQYASRIDGMRQQQAERDAKKAIAAISEIPLYKHDELITALEAAIAAARNMKGE